MFKKTPLASAIGSITLAGAFAAGAPAIAQDSEALMEEVIVTGSRIRRTVTDTPSPVSVVNRLDIDLSGMESVADVLRNTSYNTTGSFRERSGSSFGQIALVNLRGLGADRTAVLVNGRRVPGNPLTGSAAVDINSIPLSAVERVEILTDSSSAIYGADAIGGVVNIIFREDFEGAEFEIGGERPTRDGAESDHFNFTFGASGERSSIVFSGEWFKRNPVFDSDRDYSKVSVNQPAGGGRPVHNADTEGVSSGGNTGFALDFSNAFQVGATCPTDIYIPIANPEGIPGAEGCGFGYADLSMQTGGLERQSTFLDARYEIAPGHEVYFENRYSRSETFGRYAPAVGFLFVEQDAPLNNRGEPFFLFHRFVAHGNRDDQYVNTEFDNVAGLKGTLDNFDINYDVHLRYYEYRSQNEGDTYVITSIIEDLIADGSYNFLDPLSQDPDHLAAVQRSSATTFRDIHTKYTAGGITLDGALFDLPAGQVGWAAGFEAAHEDYQDQYDNQQEAGNITGTAGNSAAGGRSRWATFAEFEIPILDNLDLNLAGRYDDYDDFGSEFSPQIAVRYAPLDRLSFRASWGEGFKAPNLGSIHSELAQSFNDVTDLVFCREQGISDENCQERQVENYTGGNPELGAETTESWNFGIIAEPIDNLRLSVDWWNIEVDDAVSQPSMGEVIEAELAGSLPAGVRVNRGPGGNITNCTSTVRPPDCAVIRVFANLSTLEYEGYDVRAEYAWDTNQLGSFMAKLEYSEITTLDQQSSPGATVFDLPGTEGVPEFRYNASLRWTWNSWTANYVFRAIDSHGGGPIATGAGDYDSFDQMDLNITYSAPWGGEISFGARNLTDEGPEIDDASGWVDSVSRPLYPVEGRIPYLTYRHAF